MATEKEIRAAKEDLSTCEISSLGDTPLDATSARLQSVGTCLQCVDGIRLTVSMTLS